MSMKETLLNRRAHRFDLVELVLVASLAALVAGIAGLRVARPRVSPELEWLGQTYGPEKESQYVEEWVARDFFGNKRDGTFVDIGAADFKALSNTYYLEHALGWSGLAVDPQERYASGYAANRPRTKFRRFFVSDVSDAHATLYVNSSPWVASSKAEFTERWGKAAAVQVPTITLTDLLRAEGVSSIDFVSIDVELAEPQVLAGFDIARFRPLLVCIESHPEVRQKILDYFANHGYTAVGKYLRMDDRNLYFMPIGHPLPPFPAEVMKRWTED